jgi:hypothetical protein
MFRPSWSRVPHVRAHDPHAGSFERWSATLRADATANPTTRCWRCGRTQAQHQRPWHAGHIPTRTTLHPWVRVYHTNENARLAAECEPCNTSDGATTGNKQRQRRHSRQWL